jgi:general L-amino acid transport system permease protein
MKSINDRTRGGIFWVRENLFKSFFNSLMTLLSFVIVGFLLFGFLGFIINADWTVVEVNRRLLLLGRLPIGNEIRGWSILWLSVLLISSSIGIWGSLKIKDFLMIFLISFVTFFIFGSLNSIYLILSTYLIASGTYLFSKYFLRKKYFELAKKFLIFSWIFLIPMFILILLIGNGPKPTLWGGFLLNIILASVAIVAGFPLGLFLGLGRASSFPVIKLASTLYIEVIRGAPLVAWLLLAWFVLPTFLPSLFGLNEVSIVIRAMIVLSIFASAYIAEVIRGGLQSVPKGQLEAADALGLNPIYSTVNVILPQAIRVVIPALVSTFIAMFKDTSLVFILALTDLLQVGRLIPEQEPEFFGRQLESLLVVAFLFWVISVSLSNLSSRLEKAMGIGVR